jgi:hypothetical protein
MRRAGELLAAEHAGDLGHAGLAFHGLHVATASACHAAPWRPRSAGRRRRRPGPGGSRPAPGRPEPIERPNCFIRRPTLSATAPPTPASISSKMSVGRWPAGPLPPCAVVTAMASARRDNSPPEATLARARGVLPAWPATRSSTASSPKACGSSCVQQRHLEAAAGHAQLLHGLRDSGRQLGRRLVTQAAMPCASAARLARASAAACSSVEVGGGVQRLQLGLPRGQQRRQLGRCAAIAARQRHPGGQCAASSSARRSGRVRGGCR